MTGRFISSALLTSSLALLTGCAMNSTNNDPYECYNRSMYKFNHVADVVIARPLSDIYNALLPSCVQTGITNFFNNFYEPSRVVNDLLQGEFHFAANDSARFFINTTIGLAGLFDVAQHLELPTHTQDLGITFARWGWRDSSYFIVPFFGIYTVRDMIAAPINSLCFTAWAYIDPESLAWELYALDKLQYRAMLRPADKVIDESFDPYVFVRDAYFQTRQRQINGEVVNEKPGDEPVTVTEEKTATKGDKKSQSKKTETKPTKNLPDIISVKGTNRKHA